MLAQLVFLYESIPYKWSFPHDRPPWKFQDLRGNEEEYGPKSYQLPLHLRLLGPNCSGNSWEGFRGFFYTGRLCWPPRQFSMDFVSCAWLEECDWQVSFCMKGSPDNELHPPLTSLIPEGSSIASDARAAQDKASNCNSLILQLSPLGCAKGADKASCRETVVQTRK